MFQLKFKGRNRSNSHSTRRVYKHRKRFGSPQLGLESLEARQMLSAAPLTFHVVDDAAANRDYRYAENGAAQGSTVLVSANAAPRGVASTLGVEKTWVIDANRNVYVYNATSGALIGNWSAGSMAANATPEGIATDGTDIWIVDSKSDKVFRYAGAASRTSGSQTAASSFPLSNGSSKDMVTDGFSLWVVDDAAKTDRVYKYNLDGGWLVGSWTIDSANKAPTGITLDPANVGDMWISDSGTDRVYKYAAAVSRDSGSQVAASSFALASGNGNSQGLVVPGRPWAETPYQVEWVRQFGSQNNDEVRGVTVDESGSLFASGGVYASGGTTGPLASYLAKYDANGSQIWIQHSDSIAGAWEYNGIRVATDSQGNVFQVINLVSSSDGSTLRSYDAEGLLRWETAAPVGERLFDVTVDAQGFAYTASHESTGETVHIRKLDGSSGGVAWEVVVQALGTTGISADKMGNVYVSAHTSGALLGSTAGAQDALVIKTSEAGTVLWTRQYGSAGSDFAFYVAADPFGNVYSAGRTDGSLGGPSAGGLDVFLAKHDSAGNLLWKNQLGTSGEDTRADMWVDPQGNVYRAFETTGALGGASLGGRDIVVVKVDPQGNILWATQLGTSGEDDAAGGIWGDDQGNLYVGGGTTGSWGTPNAGSRDAYLIKLSPPAAMASSSSLDSVGASAASAASSDTLSFSTAPAEKSKRIAEKSMTSSTTSTSTNTQSVSLNLMLAAATTTSANTSDATVDTLHAEPHVESNDIPALDAAFAAFSF